MWSTEEVSGNPRDSQWYSTSRKKRRRRGIQLTLSAAAMKELTRLAKGAGKSKSQVVEDWLVPPKP